jgi:hypothetical protein
MVAGLSIVAWLHLHPADAAAPPSGGGSVVLDTAPTPSPSPVPADSLKVASSDSAKTLGAETLNAAPGSFATPAPTTASAPGPTEFKQYDHYKDEASALFGDMLVGQGQAAAAGSTLTVKYRGWLIDGTLFDENYTSGKPFSFVEGGHRVIPGWEQGLIGMKVGGKRRLIVPPGQGYGPTAHGPIPGGSVLVFDVELLGVQ